MLLFCYRVSPAYSAKGIIKTPAGPFIYVAILYLTDRSYEQKLEKSSTILKHFKN